MKKLILPAVLFASVLFYNTTEAQVRLNVNVNIGRPAWGVPGNYAGDYYYLPEIDMYYNIPQRQFVYMDNGNWLFASELPYAYRGYDLYHGYKVVVNEPRPYLNYNVYRQRYNKYYNTYRPPVVVDNRFNNRRPLVVDNRNDRRYAVRDRNDHFDNRRDNDHGRNDHDNRGGGKKGKW